MSETVGNCSYLFIFYHSKNTTSPKRKSDIIYPNLVVLNFSLLTQLFSYNDSSQLQTEHKMSYQKSDILYVPSPQSMRYDFHRGKIIIIKKNKNKKNYSIIFEC